MKDKADRTDAATEKEGVFIGRYAINPVNGKQVPIYTANFVLADYGTGASDMLMDAALGDDPASLWVLEDNPRARAFYRRHGFDPDGAVKTHTVDGAAIREVRLVRGGTLA